MSRCTRWALSSVRGEVIRFRWSLRHFGSQIRFTNPDVAPSAIHNVQSITSKWADKFMDKKIPEPVVSAELIVAHALGMKTVHESLI